MTWETCQVPVCWAKYRTACVIYGRPGKDRCFLCALIREMFFICSLAYVVQNLSYTYDDEEDGGGGDSKHHIV